MSDCGAADGLPSMGALQLMLDGRIVPWIGGGRFLVSALVPETIPDYSDDIEFELIKPGWVLVPGSGRVTVSAEARDRMVAAAMTWHRQHTVVPWHELISEARMRELVEAMLREAGDG